MLSQDENLAGLSRINRELLAKAEAMNSPQRVVLDMDSTEIPVYGEQGLTALPYLEGSLPQIAVIKNGPLGVLAAAENQNRLRGPVLK